MEWFWSWIHSRNANGLSAQSGSDVLQTQVKFDGGRPEFKANMVELHLAVMLHANGISLKQKWSQSKCFSSHVKNRAFNSTYDYGRLKTFLKSTISCTLHSFCKRHFISRLIFLNVLGDFACKYFNVLFLIVWYRSDCLACEIRNINKSALPCLA